MGKVLIEKLLRSCPEVNRIFILLRSKKNKEAAERLEDLKKVPVFDRLKIEQPQNLDKLVAVNGDVTALGLGLSAEDVERMSGVSVIYHSAASVRFDDSLKEAILMNTRGTREVMLFAEKLSNLKVLVHVSTTYCNPDQKVVEEKVYPPKCDWRTAIKVAETFDAQFLNALTEKFTNYEPNTYTFTKGLAEQVVNDFRDRVPVVIYRPSIVISSLEEPMPGWVDNFNGPIGLLIACAIGILRTTNADPDTVSDFTPVDTSIKAMIVTSVKHGSEDNLKQIQNVPVYNCSTSLQLKYTTGFIIQMGKLLSAEVPMDKMLWKPGGCITKCKYLNYMKVILFHIIPAYLVDTAFRLTGRKIL